MNRKIILSAFALILGQHAMAQTYTFSVANNPYVELDAPIYLSPETDVWDDPEFELTIPFVFQYFGVNLPAISGSYGYGAELFGTNFDLPVPVIIPVYCDPIDLGYMSDTPSSSISYQKFGVVGSRILKIQWKNIGFYGQVTDEVSPLDYMNFQLWFYEGTNVIEIHFGESLITAPFDHFGAAGPSVFLVSTYNVDTEEIGNSYYLYGNPANPTMELTTSGEVLFTSSLDATPVSGQTYIFTPGSGGSGVGIESNTLVFELFPNPTADVLNIVNTANVEITQIQILDVSGRVVKTFNTNLMQLNIEDLTAGTYFIQISTPKGQFSERVVKK